MMELNTMDDWVLVGADSETDGSFAVLFQRHKDFVFRLARGLSGDAHLAEEVTQEVFCRLFAKRRRWQKKAAFRTLLYRITVNCSRELARKKTPFQPLDPNLSIQAVDNRPEKNEQVYSQLETYIDGLPAKQREVIVLRFFEELSVKETAAALGCREGTVKAHLHRAKQNLRKRFEAQP